MTHTKRSLFPANVIGIGTVLDSRCTCGHLRSEHSDIDIKPENDIHGGGGYGCGACACGCGRFRWRTYLLKVSSAVYKNLYTH